MEGEKGLGYVGEIVAEKNDLSHFLQDSKTLPLPKKERIEEKKEKKEKKIEERMKERMERKENQESSLRKKFNVTYQYFTSSFP